MTGAFLAALVAWILAAGAVLGPLLERVAGELRRALQGRRVRIEAMRAALGPVDDEPGREVYP